MTKMYAMLTIMDMIKKSQKWQYPLWVLSLAVISRMLVLPPVHITVRALKTGRKIENGEKKDL